MTEEMIKTEFEDATESAIPSRRSKKGKEKKEKSAIREFLEMVIIAVALAVFIKTFIAGNYYIPSGSMEPTVITNDKVIVTHFSYYLSEPKRGDVIVFEYPEDRTKDYIKRCIGLPGETVEFKDSKLYVNGELIEEPYLPEGLVFDDYGPVTVPEGSYFMCGDNRNHSADSRVWGFLPEDLIIGKAQVVYWPFAHWRTL